MQQSPFPELDVGALSTALNRHQVEFVVIGVVAAQLHGAALPRTLDELDVTPARDQQNRTRLAAALKELGALLRAPRLDEGIEIPLDEHTFSGTGTMTFVTDKGPIDIAFLPDGTVGYDDLLRNAEAVEEFGASFRVASLADVIRSKEAAGRTRDIEHLPLLRQRLRELRAQRFSQERDPPDLGLDL